MTAIEYTRKLEEMVSALAADSAYLLSLFNTTGGDIEEWECGKKVERDILAARHLLERTDETVVPPPKRLAHEISDFREEQDIQIRNLLNSVFGWWE